MVKKASILQRLKGRFRSGAMRVEEGRGDRLRPDKNTARKAPADRLQGESALPAKAVAERLSGRKLSSKEEAVVALGEGFHELSNMMRGVQTRVEAQGEDVAKAAGHLEKLPDLGEQHLDVLRQLARQLEQQSDVGRSMLRTFGDLPEVLQGVRSALARSAETDERTNKTLSEFRSTMDRIEASMGHMVQSSREGSQKLATEQKAAAERIVGAFEKGQKIDTSGLEASVDGLRDVQTESARQLERTSSDGIAALRRAHEDQATRLNKLVAEHGTWNRAVVVMLALTLLVLAGILTVLAF